MKRRRRYREVVAYATITGLTTAIVGVFIQQVFPGAFHWLQDRNLVWSMIGIGWLAMAGFDMIRADHNMRMARAALADAEDSLLDVEETRVRLNNLLDQAETDGITVALHEAVALEAILDAYDPVSRRN